MKQNETLLAPVSVCQNLNIPIYNLLSGTRGPARNRHGPNIVYTLLVRLLGIDDTFLYFLFF